MRIRPIVLLIALVALLKTTMIAQISHGGSPLPFTELRSKSGDFYQTMPGFNVAEQLLLDSLEYSSLRASNRFAYKFITDFTPSNSGEQFTLADGTKIWRLGIRSEGAYSINLLFTAYELPEGAQLFLYNPSQTQVLGAFTHRNNSEKGLLPIAPIVGDEIVVEYHEPAHASFHGKLCVGEVNHDYRGFRSISEPASDLSSLSCIQPLVCSLGENDSLVQVGQSVVELIVDGMYYCTGTLLNNQHSDGTPYLLTASHCLNQQFKVKDPDYEEVAGKIVAFFNYNSPMCASPIRGTEEMTMASLYSRAVYEDVDLALLEFMEMPPVQYRPYYAGWNATTDHGGQYACIQHPGGGTKRYSLADNVKRANLVIKEHTFHDNAFWQVEEWSVGCTADGSSGSALFDNKCRVVGALTGGNSYCNSPKNDYFYALASAWLPDEQTDHQLKYWLAPEATEPITCEGLDPYEDASALRLSHVFENKKQDATETAFYDDTSYLFGLNASGITEFAEGYTLPQSAIIYGCYLVTPSINGRTTPSVEICLYSGKEKPQTLLAKKTFNPQVAYFKNGELVSDKKSLYRAQEHFISFGDSIQVKDNLFVGYRILGENDTKFCVYSVKSGEQTGNTAWMHASNGWKKASYNTSLFIDPVLRYTKESTANESISIEPPLRLFADANQKSLHVILSGEEENASLSLFDSSGRVIKQAEIRQRASSVACPASSSGLYCAIVRYQGKEYSFKVRMK